MDYIHTLNTGTPNRIGLKPIFFAAPISHFLVIEALGAATATITADHTFIATKGFVKLQMDEDQSEFLGEVVGDARNTNGAKIDLKGFMPGLDDAKLQLAQAARYDDWLLLVQDCDGNTYQIGGACGYASCKTKPSSGTKAGGKKGHEYEFMAYADLVLYTGTITEKP